MSSIRRPRCGAGRFGPVSCSASSRARRKEPTIRKTTGGNGLKIFPAKEGEDTTAADAELVGIFQKNFTEAAENFAKQAR